LQFLRFVNFIFIFQFSHGVLRPSLTGVLSLVRYVWGFRVLFGMSADPQKKSRGDLPLSPLPPFPSPPLRSRPLNPTRGLGSAASCTNRVWGGVPAEIKFGAF